MRERTTRPLPHVVSTVSNSREPERQRRGMTGNVLRKSPSLERQRRGMTGATCSAKVQARSANGAA